MTSSLFWAHVLVGQSTANMAHGESCRAPYHLSESVSVKYIIPLFLYSYLKFNSNFAALFKELFNVGKILSSPIWCNKKQFFN